MYRNYATLYFVFVVDGAESELGILDLIQVCGLGEEVGRAIEDGGIGPCRVSRQSV